MQVKGDQHRSNGQKMEVYRRYSERQNTTIETLINLSKYNARTGPILIGLNKRVLYCFFMLTSEVAELSH